MLEWLHNSECWNTFALFSMLLQ